MIKFQPVIKWTGSKRTQSNEIIKHFPSKIKTYYEPFIGGGSVLYTLLKTNNIEVDNYICSDINQDLINLWNMIKMQPKYLSQRYEEMWNELNIDDDIERRKMYYNKVRTRYNNDRNPEDFMFILRTTTNGLVRYNSKGEFNNSFHFSRKGINPQKLKTIIAEWSYLLNEKNVQFICCDYKDLKPTEDDFMYLDPPYFGTNGMYFGKINYDVFWDKLRDLKCLYIFSFDGKTLENDYTYNVPMDIYNEHIYLNSGISSFRNYKKINTLVYESLYIKNKIS